MKIGVLLTCYNCEDYVDKCLEPWLNLKEEYNFVIAANSGMFKDYLTLGISEKNEGTVKKLLEKKLDFLVTTSGKNLLDEDYSRDVCLDFLRGGRWGRNEPCDLLIVVDGDEIYTEENIRKIIKFVKENPDHEGYKLNFKNYSVKKGLFVDYRHDRIFWMNRHGGINRFYFDNQFEYVDHALGKKEVKYKDSCMIPKSVAFIEHYSWLSEDPRTLDKIEYQQLRYTGLENQIPKDSRCSYYWNNEANSLRFNKKHYDYWNLNVPVLREVVNQNYSLEISLDFLRKENRLTICNHSLEGKYLFSITSSEPPFTKNEDYEIIGGKVEFSCDMELKPGWDYWINPSNNFNLDELGFEHIVVKIYEKSQMQIIHEEKIHLKL
jgi:hypothetical protein